MTDSDDLKASTSGNSSSVVQNQVSPGLVILTSILLGGVLVGMVFMFMAMDRIDRHVDRELRIMSLKIDETNMILIREGKRRPGDAIKGPAMGGDEK